MGLITQGKRYHPSYKMAFVYNAVELFSQEVNSFNRYKIIFIRSGTGIVSINAHSYACMAPALCCLTETDRVLLEEGANIKAESLYFHPTVVNESLTFSRIRRHAEKAITADQMDYDSLRPFHQKNRSEELYSIGPMTEQQIRALFNGIQEQLERQPDRFWPCRSRSYLIELLFVILQVYINETQEQGSILHVPSHEISPILLYLLNNYQRKITLAELTKEFGTNRNTLNQKFKKATGFSVIEYVIQLRVRIACQLLKDTDLPVVEIAEHVGYIDVTHFGRIFRKHIQLTPTEYRERHKRK